MYFPEDKKALNNVPASHIKSPITSGRTAQPLSKYKGKEFHDKGSTGEDPVVPYFEAGDFVVTGVAPGNNSFCNRIGVPNSEETFDIGYVLKRIKIYEDE